MIFYSATDEGRVRRINQDYLFASKKPVGKLPNLLIVADGMGGHNAGERASSYAVEVLVETIRNSRERNPIKCLRSAIEEANRRVLEESRSEEMYHGMGTTIVAATVIKGNIYVANVGDSRLYIIGNRMFQVTRDHSLVEEMIRSGGLTREEGKNHPDRHIITRAVGVDQKVDVDFFEWKLKKDDVILLCSDGLTNMVSDEEIQQIVRNSEDLQEAGDRLVALANENGGSDNITVLLAKMRVDEVR